LATDQAFMPSLLSRVIQTWVRSPASRLKPNTQTAGLPESAAGKESFCPVSVSAGVTGRLPAAAEKPLPATHMNASASVLVRVAVVIDVTGDLCPGG
jgi:hypothetical protein